MFSIILAAIDAECDEIIENLTDEISGRDTLRKGSGIYGTKDSKTKRFPVVEALRKQNVKIVRRLLDFGFAAPMVQLNAVLPEILQFNEANVFLDLLFEFSCIESSVKVGKEPLLKVVLDDESIENKLTIVQTLTDHKCVCGTSTIEKMVSSTSGTEMLNEITTKYQQNEIAVEKSAFPILEALRKGNLGIMKTLLQFGISGSRENIITYLPNVLKYGDAHEYWSVLLENRCIAKDVKINKEYLLKAVLDHSEITSESQLAIIQTLASFDVVCSASMLDKLVIDKENNGLLEEILTKYIVCLIIIQLIPTDINFVETSMHFITATI